MLLYVGSESSQVAQRNVKNVYIIYNNTNSIENAAMVDPEILSIGCEEPEMIEL